MKKNTALFLAALLLLSLLAVPAAATAEPAAAIPTPAESTADTFPEESPEIPPEDTAAPKNPGEAAEEPARAPEEPGDTAGAGVFLVIPPALETAAGEAPAPVTDGALRQVTLSGVSHQSDARSTLSLINSFRTGPDAWYWNESNTAKVSSPGSALTYDYALEQIAMQRAAEIAVSFSHTRPDGTRCFTCTYNGVQSWGENIAMGSAGYYSPEDIFVLWREDDDDYSGQGHRRNMLKTDFTAVGIACFEYDGYVWWVQEFGYDVSSVPYTAPADGAASFTVDVWQDDSAPATPVPATPTPATPVPATPTPATPTPASPPADSIEVSGANFPDGAFRDIITLYADENKDGWLSPAERSSFTALSCVGYGITSLRGIEYFPNLEVLYCADNDLTSLDLSKNPRLRLLWCEDNWLSSLDLSPCPDLEELDCYDNELSALDVSGCPKLEKMDCSYNNITSLKLGANAALLWLYVEGNPLSVLDISLCPEMVALVESGTPERKGDNGEILVYLRRSKDDGETYWGLSYDENTQLVTVTTAARTEMDAVRILRGLVGLPDGVAGTPAEAAEILRSLG